MMWFSVTKLGLSVVVGVVVGSAGLGRAALDGSRYMWFAAPATDWETGTLLIGCGRLGAAVFGGGNEVVTLSEDTIWSGPIQERIPPEGRESFPTVRKLLVDGQISEGGELCLRKMSPAEKSERAYSYFGSLHLDFGHPDDFDDYVRSLDTRKGNIVVSYTYDGVHYTREYVANYPTNVLAARITASEGGVLNFNAYFSRIKAILSNKASTAGGSNTITMVGSSGQALGNGPLLFTGQARFVADGAEITASGGNLTISGATTVDIFFDAETNYRYSTQEAWEAEMNKKLDAAVEKGFAALKQEAVADAESLIGRASLDLGESPDGQAILPLNQRITNAREALTDIELVTLTWNYGRHLLVAASRDTEGIIDMPPNLIGVWNNATTAAWGGKFTININTEMNLWPAGQTNLAEMAMPLFDLMAVAKPRGEKMAKELYGCGGIVFHHNLDIWGDTAPTDNYTSSTMWPMGAAWLVQHMIDHYRFTGDKVFLKEVAYPYLVDVARFYECYAFMWNGSMVTGPSLSPENSFKIPSEDGWSRKGEVAAMDIAPEMDNQLMRDVMLGLMEAAVALGISEDDEDLSAAKEFLALIREPQVGSYGQLLEWRREYTEKAPGQKHLSPLYGLHPSNQFAPLVNETRYNAAKVLLDRRVKHGSGTTGWSRAWLVNQYARALSGADAWTHVEKWFATFATTALWNTDNGRGFQIDGNYGMTSGITEMLLQSHAGLVHLLPALPADAVPTGSTNGLLARGGFEVDMEWKDGKFKTATVTSKRGNELELRIRDSGDFFVNGKPYRGAIQTEAGQKYVITP